MTSLLPRIISVFDGKVKLSGQLLSKHGCWRERLPVNAFDLAPLARSGVTEVSSTEQCIERFG
ncbi:hypothetical protein [Altererythrobacter sp.]|uniref:hypothetical protein n=1 Tax=Altererythrobacter sp. TaxID=1872480 RepID=UPI001B247323|nr:hypothetical protein [Altererythrobacter sp.]MBO6945655.1 hypothetical protein [Altererythrobacter sp.]